MDKATTLVSATTRMDTSASTAPAPTNKSDDEVEAELLKHTTSSGNSDPAFYAAVIAETGETVAPPAGTTAQAGGSTKADKSARPPAPEGEGARARKAQAKEDKKPWGLKLVSQTGDIMSAGLG